MRMALLLRIGLVKGLLSGLTDDVLTASELAGGAFVDALRLREGVEKCEGVVVSADTELLLEEVTVDEVEIAEEDVAGVGALGAVSNAFTLREYAKSICW